MCQPKPLARCVNHARKDLENSQKAVLELNKEHDENRAELKKLHKQHNNLIGEIGATNDASASQDRELNAIGEKIEKAGLKVRESKKALEDARDNVTAKEMLVDATKTGRKDLATYGNTEYNAVRLQVAEEMAKWQRELKGRNDFSGYPVIDKEGKFSDQAVPIFRAVLNQSQTNYYAAQQIELVAGQRVKRAEIYISQTEKQAKNKNNRPEETNYFQKQNTVAKEDYQKELRNKDLARRERIMYETQIKDMQEAVEKAKANSFDSSW